uniref:Adenine nucleotide translocase lysine methyltransferase n=1 Tax=Scleropages formosus TaxID=113540 RepID=A0A8C9SX80_SCLFO
MDPDSPEEALPGLSDRPLGGWGLLQVAAGSGLAVYAVWAGILMPGFRRVPLRLQVPYLPASRAQVANVMSLLKGRPGGLTDLGSGDGRIVLEAYRQGFRPAVGYELNPWLVRLARFHAWRAGHYGKVSYLREDLWKVNLEQCKNISVFLAPSVVSTPSHLSHRVTSVHSCSSLAALTQWMYHVHSCPCCRRSCCWSCRRTPWLWRDGTPSPIGPYTEWRERGWIGPGPTSSRHRDRPPPRNPPQRAASPDQHQSLPQQSLVFPQNCLTFIICPMALFMFGT